MTAIRMNAPDESVIQENKLIETLDSGKAQ